MLPKSLIQINFFLWILFSAFGMIFPSAKVVAAESDLYNPQGKRDPFVPLVSLTMRETSGLVGIENIDDVTVEGVVFDEKKGSIAVINGSILKEGEEFGSLKVLRIKPDGVLFLLNGNETFKPLYKEEVKGK